MRQNVATKAVSSSSKSPFCLSESTRMLLLLPLLWLTAVWASHSPLRSGPIGGPQQARVVRARRISPQLRQVLSTTWLHDVASESPTGTTTDTDTDSEMYQDSGSVSPHHEELRTVKLTDLINRRKSADGDVAGNEVPLAKPKAVRKNCHRSSDASQPHGTTLQRCSEQVADEGFRTRCCCCEW
ncbi:MAG: hypothetical protein MHM6MM_001089 [Cercozoa sp. M6MM]